MSDIHTHSASKPLANGDLDPGMARVSTSHDAPPHPPSDDSGALMRAIAGRLRAATDCVRCVQTQPLSTVMLECAEALEQLHSLTEREQAQHRQLHGQIAAVQEQLRHTLAELVNTRVGKRQAQHHALHDGLTALPNRDYFRQRLDRRLRSAQQGSAMLAVMFIDLDAMKAVNDAHGHQVGDELLKVVASRMARTVREDDMVSRQGGDEFALLLSNLPDRHNAAQVAAKLFEAVAAPLQIGALKLCVHPSIGIALCPGDGQSADTLLQNADAAMYRAKRLQCRYSFFDDSGVAVELPS